jgi:ankyrin repeat protein
MNKNLFLGSLAFLIFISINALDKQEIKNLAQKYVVATQLKQNMLNQKLIIAVRMRKNNHFFIDLVKNQGASINAIDLQGRTALVHAAMLKEYEIATTLLELGSSIEIKDSFGKTALDYAYENNDERMIQLIESFQKLKLFKSK